MSVEFVTTVAVALGAVMLYFVPAVVAIGRERNRPVLLINLLTGWTIVGWVVALVMATRLPRKSTAGPGERPMPCPACARENESDANVCAHCGHELMQVPQR